MVKTVILAARVTLEFFGAGLIISVLAFKWFPGALRGIGVSDVVLRSYIDAESSHVAPPLAPSDLAAIMLAVATIVLATVAFIISVGAFWGFKEIKDIAERVAKAEVKKATDLLDNLVSMDQQKINSALYEMRSQIDQLRQNVAEELNQSKGLLEGKAADAIAQAAGGEPSNEVL